MMLVLCVAMVFNSGDYGAKAVGSEMDDYVLDIISDMLVVNSYKDLENITISNSIVIADIGSMTLTDKRMYFVLDGSEIIGT